MAEQLDSILAQDLQPDEIVVQDDLSTDDTWAILEDYAARYPHIHLYRNESRLGVNLNFFTAIGRVTGDYIALSDQDDIWLPHKLSRQMTAIGDRLLCAHPSQSFTDESLIIETDRRRPNYSLMRMAFVGTFAGHSLLMSRSLLPLIPMNDGRPPTFRLYDVVISMVAAAYESIVFIDHPLVLHRRTATAATYTAPTDRSRSLSNIFGYLTRTLRLSRELRPAIRQRMSDTHRFLLQIDARTTELTDALRLTELMSRPYSPRLTVFCIGHATRLFHTSLPPTLVTRLRGALFPTTCSEYFRGMSRRDGHV